MISFYQMSVTHDMFQLDLNVKGSEKLLDTTNLKAQCTDDNGNIEELNSDLAMYKVEPDTAYTCNGSVEHDGEVIDIKELKLVTHNEEDTDIDVEIEDVTSDSFRWVTIT